MTYSRQNLTVWTDNQTNKDICGCSGSSLPQLYHYTMEDYAWSILGGKDYGYPSAKDKETGSIIVGANKFKPFLRNQDLSLDFYVFADSSSLCQDVCARSIKINIYPLNLQAESYHRLI